jgi:transcriptional regulator with GAF, ATPase, and Fis domain
MRRLESYRWPGNVRELQNVIERAVILSVGPSIGLDALPELGAAAELTGPRVEAAPAASHPGAPANEAGPGPAPRAAGVRLPRAIDENERGYVARVLQETAWVVEGAHGAARLLGLHPNTLRSRMKRWGLKRPGDRILAAV